MGGGEEERFRGSHIVRRIESRQCIMRGEAQRPITRYNDGERQVRLVRGCKRIGKAEKQHASGAGAYAMQASAMR